jgi:putative transposase
MKYRRINAPSGAFFFTLVTFEQLCQAFRYVMLRHPFTIETAVVLPDHLQLLWRVPQGDSD